MLFDATNASETGVEPGEHIIIVDDAEVKESKSGGEYINVRFKLEESGSTFYSMYNIKNANQKAVDIGLAGLKKLCINGGVEPKGDVDTLIGLRVLAKLKIKEDDYGEKVVISSMKKAPKAEAF